MATTQKKEKHGKWHLNALTKIAKLPDGDRGKAVDKYIATHPGVSTKMAIDRRIWRIRRELKGEPYKEVRTPEKIVKRHKKLLKRGELLVNQKELRFPISSLAIERVGEDYEFVVRM